MNYRHFSIEEREKIQLGLWDKKSLRTIAQELGRSPASVSREIKRNCPPQRFLYTPRLAQARALHNRTRRGRTERLKNQFIRECVALHLKRGWSPEQIAGRMRYERIGNISHEAIYQYIYAQVQPSSTLVRAGREDLRPYLKRRHRTRVKKGGRRCWRLMRPTVPAIDTRPAVVQARSRVGDWEGDTIESLCHRPGVNTLVERKTGLVCITKLAGRTALDTSEAVSKRLRSLPAELRQTLTLDNGTENSDWQALEADLDMKIFFAHPYHSWERGTNENTNGLIRYYFPKKTDFTMIPTTELSRVEWELNHRPRKRLGYRTPQEVFGVALQS